MFFDPSCKPEVKVDPTNLEPFIAWAEKEPADRPYVYSCTHRCLLHEYFTACGYKTVWIGGNVMALDGKDYNLGVLADISWKRPHTIGAALRRAKALV